MLVTTVKCSCKVWEDKTAVVSNVVKSTCNSLHSSYWLYKRNQDVICICGHQSGCQPFCRHSQVQLWSWGITGSSEHDTICDNSSGTCMRTVRFQSINLQIGCLTFQKVVAQEIPSVRRYSGIFQSNITAFMQGEQFFVAPKNIHTPSPPSHERF